MAAQCDEFTKDSDNLLEFELWDQRDDPRTFVSTATVTATFFDDAGALDGVGWPIAVPFDAVRVKYLGTIPAAAVVTVGDRIRAEINAVDGVVGTSKFHLRNIPVVEQVPE